MSVIHTNRFDSARNRRARHVREYDQGRCDLDARNPGQMVATRWPDPLHDDISMMACIAGVIVGGLVFAIFLYAWIAGPIEVTL